jgi:aryl-alcohol dehydrogenase-like predicted oxidoreductase
LSNYRKLGRTGVRVMPFCLGTMMFGKWGNPDHDDSVRVIHAALDAGINFLDTADVYSLGESEEIVGKALKGRREKVVLATKFTGTMGDDINMRGGSRRWIMREVEDSLRRLDTDYIDLYQVHRPDPAVDIEETLGALSDLVHQGKVRYIGCSTFPAEQIVESRWASERRNLERFVCEQPPYSIFVRQVEQAVLPTCMRYDMGVIAWSPLNGGWLTGKYRRDAAPPGDSRMTRARIPERFDLTLPGNQRKLDLVDDLDELARDAGLSMTHMALAWVLQHPAVTAAIIGPRTMEQLQDVVPAMEIKLAPDVLNRIDELVPAGTTVHESDNGYLNPHLQPDRRRRRDQ